MTIALPHVRHDHVNRCVSSVTADKKKYFATSATLNVDAFVEREEMLSSRIDMTGEGERDGPNDATMPGDEELWSRLESRSKSRAKPWPPKERSRVVAQHRSTSKPKVSSARVDRSRERSPSHHRSPRSHRIITVPFDHHPSFDLRGTTTRMLEIERIPCRRRRQRRRCCSSCREMEDDAVTFPMVPQSNIIVAQPIANGYWPSSPPSFMSPCGSAYPTPASLANLTPEMIASLPKKVVHLPPIHMPGSQADANTELHTVTFAAELINPADGTLSTIQADRQGYSGGMSYSQPATKVPMSSENTLGPFMQQIHKLMQQWNTPQAPQSLPPSDFTQFQSSTANAGPYPPANIRPTATSNIESPPPSMFSTQLNSSSTAIPYYAASSTFASPDGGPYRPANITPYKSIGNSYSLASAPIVNSGNDTRSPLQASYPAAKPMLKSILRNRPSYTLSSPSYTR